MLNGVELPSKDLFWIDLQIGSYNGEQLVYRDGFGAMDSRFFPGIHLTDSVQRAIKDLESDRYKSD